MTCSLRLLSRQTLAPLAFAGSAFAVGACTNTATSSAVQPLSNHVTPAKTITWAFTKVENTTGSNYAVTGINDAGVIAGTYTAKPVSTTTYKSVTNSYIAVPQSSGTYQFTNDNYPYAVESNVSAINPDANATATMIEAGWVLEPGHLNNSPPYPAYGVANNHGLWSVMHPHPGEDQCSNSSEKMELLGINDAQTAVGFYTKTPTSKGNCTTDVAFEVTPGGNYNSILPSLSSDYSSSMATGINDNNDTAGLAMTSSKAVVAWYLCSGSQGTLEVLKVPGIQFSPQNPISINGSCKNSSEMIAGSYTDTAGTHGFVCNPNAKNNSQCSSYETVPDPCGGCGSNKHDTVVYGINDSNDICGSYFDSDDVQVGFVGIASGSVTLRRKGRASGGSAQPIEGLRPQAVKSQTP